MNTAKMSRIIAASLRNEAKCKTGAEQERLEQAAAEHERLAERLEHRDMVAAVMAAPREEA